MEKYQIKGDLVSRQIAGEHLLIPTGATALQLTGIINLSESAMLLYNLLQTERTEDELVSALLDEYDTDRETAQADVSAFLGPLRELGLV